MTPTTAIPVFLVSIAVMLVASAVFARRLDHVGLRLGLPEALLGLLTALAADAPSITAMETTKTGTAAEGVMGGRRPAFPAHRAER